MPKDEARIRPASEPQAHYAETALPDGLLNWNAISFEVLCSRCDYNLRMLPRPRCPECGLEFEWQGVLDRAASKSDFLFERQWRKKPVRSWLQTVWRSFRPWRFWREISLHDQVHPGPLWFMPALSVISALLILHAGAGLGFQILEASGWIWPLPHHGSWWLSPSRAASGAFTSSRLRAVGRMRGLSLRAVRPILPVRRPRAIAEAPFVG